MVRRSSTYSGSYTSNFGFPAMISRSSSSEPDQATATALPGCRVLRVPVRGPAPPPAAPRPRRRPPRAQEAPPLRRRPPRHHRPDDDEPLDALQFVDDRLVLRPERLVLDAAEPRLHHPARDLNRRHLDQAVELRNVDAVVPADGAQAGIDLCDGFAGAPDVAAFGPVVGAEGGVGLVVRGSHGGDEHVRPARLRAAVVDRLVAEREEVRQVGATVLVHYEV